MRSAVAIRPAPPIRIAAPPQPKAPVAQPANPVALPANMPAQARAILQQLEQQIASLEQQNTAKVAQVNQLTQQLAQRKAEVQQQWQQKRNIGIIGALFGVPLLTAASLITMQNDDARVQQINRDLSAAQAGQAATATKLQQYNALKQSVQQKIAALEQAGPPVTQGAPATVTALLGATAARTRLENERALLVTVRDAARSIGVQLDGDLRQLDTAIADADRALEASKRQTLELIKALIAPDPEQASLDLLKGMAKDRLKQTLGPQVDRMLQGVTEGPAKAQLRSQLLDALVNGLLG
jgi:hypothetical protein